MELRAERVKQLNCGKCGKPLDPAKYKPLSSIDCPECGGRMTVPALFGDFFLTMIVGRGAAGIVCKALDEKLHRQVALKILSNSHSDSELVAACKHEARAMARLNHPHVVQVHDIGEYKDQPFIVMELLDGGSAEKLLNGSPADEATILQLAIDVAEGLQAAQRVGLTHLDVKPANILFDKQKTAKVIDFGVAKASHKQQDGVVGTPYYVAPELARGEQPDQQADIYSLGATLFHLLAGHPPFEGADVRQVILARMKGPPPDLMEHRPDVNPETAEVVARMLAREKSDRYTNYDEVLAALESALLAVKQSKKIAAAPPKPRTQPMSPPKKTKPFPVGLAAVAGLVVVAMIAGAVVMLRGGEEKPAAPKPRPIAETSAVETPAPKIDTPKIDLVNTPPRGPDAAPNGHPVNLFTAGSWVRLDPIEMKSASGAVLTKQADGSVLVSGDLKPGGDIYTIVAETQQKGIKRIGLEVLYDDALQNKGPGRQGDFVLTGFGVETAPKATPKDKYAIVFEKAESDFDMEGFGIARAIDSDPASGWSISPNVGKDHWAWFQVGGSVGPEGGSILTFTLKQEGPQGSIGRFRLWVIGGGTAPPPPVIVAAPQPANPGPQPAVPTGPVPHPMNAFLPEGVALADSGEWSVLDIVDVTSLADAKKQPDGSVLIPTKTDGDSVYKVTATTSLKNITGLRLDVLPNDSLPNKGPGWAGDGNLILSDFVVSDVAGTKVELASATADFEQDQNWRAAMTIDGDPNNGWAVGGQTGKPHWLMVIPKSPIAQGTQTTLIIFMRHKNSMPIGHFMLSVTTGEKPLEIKSSPALPQPQYLVGFVPLDVMEFKSGKPTTQAKQPDGSLLIKEPIAGPDSYEVTLKSDLPRITALRLEAIHDPSLPSRGPGRVANGNFAISEIAAQVAPLDNPDQKTPLVFKDASTDFAQPGHPIDNVLDGKPATDWAVLGGHPDSDRVAVFVLDTPIVAAKGSVVTLKIDQKLTLGRFRVLATGIADVSKVQVKEEQRPRVADVKPPKGVDKPKDKDEELEIYLTLGGKAFQDPAKHDWKPVGGTSKVEGGEPKTETNAIKDPRLQNYVEHLQHLKVVVPNGNYAVTLFFCEPDHNKPAGQRTIDVKVEGKDEIKGLDIVKDAPGPRAISKTIQTTVTDGELTLDFGGKDQLLNAIVITGSNPKKR
jgi:serine/threonine protein kinase